MKFDAISFKNQNKKNWTKLGPRSKPKLSKFNIKNTWDHFVKPFCQRHWHVGTLARWHVGRTLKAWSQGWRFESGLTLRVSDVMHRTSGRIGRRAALRHRRRRHRRRRRRRYSQRRRDVVPTDVRRRRRRYRRNRVDVVVARVEVHFLVIVMLILMKHLEASML